MIATPVGETEAESEDGMTDNEVDMEEAGPEAGPTVVKEGWLMKRGEVIKNWRPRFGV